MKLPGSVLSDFLANGVGSAVLQFIQDHHDKVPHLVLSLMGQCLTVCIIPLRSFTYIVFIFQFYDQISVIPSSSLCTCALQQTHSFAAHPSPLATCAPQFIPMGKSHDNDIASAISASQFLMSSLQTPFKNAQGHLCRRPA